MTIVLKAKDIMVKDIIYLDEDANVFDAVKTMVDNNIGCVAIKREEKFVGIITERDVLSRVIAKKKDFETTKLREIMSSPLITIEGDASLYRVSRKLVEHNIKRIFVEENGEIVGLISQRDLVREIMNAFLSLIAI